jgi:hypothetical protein
MTMPDDDAPPPPFDLEAVYDAEIYPLMVQIIERCQAHKVPMFATFCYRSNEDGYDFATTLLPRDGWQAEPIRDAAAHLINPKPRLMAFTITKAEWPGEDSTE